VIGSEVFDKGPAFDPRSDPIVRVQARRLRAQLARYYREEGQTDEILIELPKGGYTPTFKPFRGVVTKRTALSPLVSRNTILVMPFLDHSEAGDREYFCAGLTQETIHKLAGLEAIRVIAGSKSGSDREQDPRDAAARDNAALILTGSVRKAGAAIRVVRKSDGTP